MNKKIREAGLSQEDKQWQKVFNLLKNMRDFNRRGLTKDVDRCIGFLDEILEEIQDDYFGLLCDMDDADGPISGLDENKKRVREVAVNTATKIVAKDETGAVKGTIAPESADPAAIGKFLKPGKNRMVVSESNDPTENMVAAFLRERVVVPAGMIAVANENGETIKEFPANDAENVAGGLNFVKRAKGRAMIAG